MTRKPSPLVGTRFQTGTEQRGGLTSLVDTLGKLDPSGELVRDLLGQQAKSDLEAIQESQEQALGGRNLGGLKPPSGKQLGAALDIAALGEGAGAIGRGAGGGAASLADVLGGLGRSRPTVRGVAGKALSKAEPGASKALRGAVAGRAGRAASKVPAPVRTGAKVGTRAATAPIRHPFTAPVAAQVPTAALHGKPSELGKAFTGEGAYANIAAALGEGASSAVPGEVAQNIVRDAFNLPAVALPSVYLPLAGAVEASQGRPERLEKLWHDYTKGTTENGQQVEGWGVIPKLVEGDLSGALERVKAHPLFTGLELSGAKAVVGRGAGAVLRNASKGKIAGTARPPVYIRGLGKYGNVNDIMGRPRYSPDLFNQLAQRAYDARRGRFIEPGTSRAKGVLGRDSATRAITHRTRRFIFGAEQARRVNRSERQQFGREIAPKKGRFRIDKGTANVVGQAVQRIGRHSNTFAQDLPKLRALLDREYEAGGLTKAQKRSNREMADQIDTALESGNPAEAVRAADKLIEAQGEIVNELYDRGLLNREQGERRALLPYAEVHMGAKYGRPAKGEPKQWLDAEGKPLPTEAIVAHMESNGVKPPGFVSQKPRRPGAGAYFQRWFPERQSIPTKRYTGKAQRQGTYDASYPALIEQYVYAGSKLDAAKTFDRAMNELVLPAPEGPKSLSQLRDALDDPALYGWEHPAPGVKLRPIRTAPYRAAAEEIAKAQEHQNLDASPLLDPSQAPAAEALGSKLLKASTEEGPGPYGLIPEAAFKELEGQFRRAGTAEKVGGVLNQFAKSAWLPFSPAFYMGNFVDQYLRTALSGIGPSDMLLGYQFIHDRRGRLNLPWSKRERIPGLQERDLAGAESIVSGAGYSSVLRERVHYADHQFEGTAAEGFARGLQALSRHHGPKEAWLAFRKARDIMLGFNAKLTERLPAYGALGKELRREMQAKTGAWHHALMISDKAFRDLVEEGARNTPKQIAYAKGVEQVLGNWGKNSPAARHILSNFAPFWQWARASTRFVFMTLPAHHPIKTGLLAAAAEMTEAERKRLGLDRDADEPLPDYIQGTIPTGGGAVLRNPPKYTSFGVFSDYPAFVARLFLPQLQSPGQALQGFDWKGDQLVDSEGRPVDGLKRAELALVLGVEQFIPGLSLLEGITGRHLQPGGTGTPELRKFSPFAEESAEKTRYLRSLSQKRQIKVPVKGSRSGGSSGSSGSSRYDYSNLMGGGGSGRYDYSNLMGGG